MRNIDGWEAKILAGGEGGPDAGRKRGSTCLNKDWEIEKENRLLV